PDNPGDRVGTCGDGAFFFQAEDGIRFLTVTGVQTCALPISSSMQYKQTKKSLPEIARELSVDGIVEGTVQRSGDRVRITAQLIRSEERRVGKEWRARRGAVE